jgi:hypothetical protein
MGKLLDSLKETVLSKLKQPARQKRPSREQTPSGTRSTEKEAEHAPPERVGEIVGHSSSG